MDKINPTVNQDESEIVETVVDNNEVSDNVEDAESEEDEIEIEQHLNQNNDVKENNKNMKIERALNKLDSSYNKIR